ncbi:MAG: hypothetical protein A2Z96_07955 [Spirochaetes bacterium GWB1_48_6]|nr:MAG: hypothetical protein A2Z96_07955 [Spirochaetes bacterium GWB1_48_6]
MLVSYFGTYDDGVIKLSEKPEGISHARVIITLIPDEEGNENQATMKLAEAVFDEWDNDVDSVYDTL